MGENTGVVAQHPLGKARVVLILHLHVNEHQRRRAITLHDLDEEVGPPLAGLVLRGDLLQLGLAEADRTPPVDARVNLWEEQFQKRCAVLLNGALPGAVVVGGWQVHAHASAPLYPMRPAAGRVLCTR